jgi:hypothetical protein
MASAAHERLRLDNPSDRIGGDRRLTRRYPVELQLEYKVLSGDQVINTGKGQTCNMSSGGMQLHSDTPLPVGVSVELSVFWPSQAEAERPVTLVARASVVRSEMNLVAVQVTRYEFATDGRYLLRRGPGANVPHGLRVVPPRSAGAEAPARPCVLVVESHSTQLVVRALLERKGYTVLPFSVPRALRELNRRETRIDLLITDTPQEFAAYPDLRLLCLVGAQAPEPNLTRAQRLDCLILRKPFTYPELLEACRALLEPGINHAGERPQ